MLEPAKSAGLLASLQARAKDLLDDVSAFQAYLQTQNSEDFVEVRHFSNNVQAEVKSLARVSVSDDTHEPEDEEQEARRLHMLHSTNLPFYEAVWSAATQCRGVTALGKRMHWVPRSDANTCLKTTSGGRLKPASKVNGQSAQKKSVLIDVVADGGLEWVKVSTVTARRLLFEIAKEGWEKYAYSEESDSDGSSEKPDLELVRLARDLYTASLQVRVFFRHPRVRLLLPKVTEGDNVDVDAILQDLRAIGVVVQCGEHPRSNRSDGQALATIAPNRFEAMLPSPPKPLTSTLNVDCTLLLALISDISHVPPSALPDQQILPNNKRSYHSAIIRQISQEECSPLLPTKLYPVLIGRKLICTMRAAKRACEIVDTMGTPTERARANVFLGHGIYANMDDEQLRQGLKQYSVHPVPDELCVAISQIDFEPEDAFSMAQSEQSAFPAAIAMRAIEKMSLSSINRSVFLYGWCENIVTTTSNQAVAARLVQTINDVLDDQEQATLIKDVADDQQEEFRGPQIWLCETARSLIGKHKSNGKSLHS